MIDELEKKYKVIAITIYEADTIKELCVAINKILQKEKVNNVILYGLSLGGLMAQSYLKRNKDKVNTLILSHCCTPKSSTYQKKVLLPLRVLNIFLPLVWHGLIKWSAKNFAGGVQGVSKQTQRESVKDQNRIDTLTQKFGQEFRDKYFTKRLLKTWINLHSDFARESFQSSNLSNWRGQVLILRSDNDPLVQDEGDFQRLYPTATIHTFHNTGHLAYYYQFPTMIKIIHKFLNRLVK